MNSNKKKVYKNIEKLKKKNIDIINYGISNRKNKKFYVSFLKNNKIHTIHFGNINYEDFTKHQDLDRRDRYLSRATKIRDKNGKLTKNNILSPNYWSINILWM